MHEHQLKPKESLHLKKFTKKFTRNKSAHKEPKLVVLQ